MKKEEKKESIKFWDVHAKLWEVKAYDKKRKFLNFPISGARQEITVSGISKLAKRKSVSICDLGAANGELVIDLLKKGFINATGTDNSPKMVKTAKKKLKKEMPHLNPDDIFFVEDADEFGKGNKFDFVSAMGLIEYLEDVKGFFKKLGDSLNQGGYAFIESRNKLFNLFSANGYTLQFPAEGLVNDLEYSVKFSKIQDKAEVQRIIKNSFILAGKNLKMADIGGKNKKRN